MKRQLQWVLAAILISGTMTALTACSDNDSDGGDTPKAVVTVKTAALYEQLGITDEIKEFLADSKNYIDATVLLYDQQGSLKGKFAGQAHTLDPLEIKVSGVADGTYTLLAVQTGAKGEPQWSLKNEGSLSEVEMTMPDETQLPPYMSLGSATQTVTVNDGALRAEVSAEALGAIIEVQVKGLTKDDNVNRLTLDNWIVLNGIYLGPNRTGSDRLDVADYDGRILNILGDKKGPVIEGDVSWKNFSLYCVDYQVGLQVYKGVFGEEFSHKWMEGGTTLKTGGKYVFYVDNDGKQLKQMYCGTYEGLDAWLKKRAEHPYAIYPYLKFGASLDEVRKHVKANDESWIEYGMFKPEGESRWINDYYIANNSVRYFFETEDGKNLCFVQYYYNSGTLSSEVMVPQLEEMGFIYKGAVKFPSLPDDQFFLYLTEDGETEVLRSERSFGGWTLEFMPTDPNDLEYLVTE
jgi:hypothetical protein